MALLRPYLLNLEVKPNYKSKFSEKTTDDFISLYNRYLKDLSDEPDPKQITDLLSKFPSAHTKYTYMRHIFTYYLLQSLIKHYKDNIPNPCELPETIRTSLVPLMQLNEKYHHDSDTKTATKKPTDLQFTHLIKIRDMLQKTLEETKKPLKAQYVTYIVLCMSTYGPAPRFDEIKHTILDESTDKDTNILTPNTYIINKSKTVKDGAQITIPFNPECYNQIKHFHDKLYPKEKYILPQNKLKPMETTSITKCVQKYLGPYGNRDIRQCYALTFNDTNPEHMLHTTKTHYSAYNRK